MSFRAVAEAQTVHSGRSRRGTGLNNRRIFCLGSRNSFTFPSLTTYVDQVLRSRKDISVAKLQVDIPEIFCHLSVGK
jgi:hypothetical protein